MLRTLVIVIPWTLSLALADLDRQAAVLDLSSRIGEGASGLLSMTQAMSVAGIPYMVTANPAEAVHHPVVYVACRIPYGTLTHEEVDLLRDYLDSGGTLAASFVTDDRLFDFCGVRSATASNQRHRLTWNISAGDGTTKWFADDNEITISLGNPRYPSIFYSQGYTCEAATPLAFFDDAAVAATVSQYGAGTAYLFGCQFRDVIIRNLTNHDFDAEREYSNIFEPTTDTLFLWFREIYCKAVPNAAWVNTSPANTRNTLMVTHDIDCFPSMELMLEFADWETQQGLRADYFITTHYMTDWDDGNYYDPFIDELTALCATPHVVGSHSVGHFPDFMREELFPEGAPGNIRGTYQPHYDGTVTSGGTVFGELEVSRDLLNADCGANVKYFRAGYLFYNDLQFDALEDLGYDVDASFSANELLSHFPLHPSSNCALNGPLTGLIEVPLSISDDTGMNSTNYIGWLDRWREVFLKCRDNGAPCVLLIHPTDRYKLDAEQRFCRMIPADTAMLPLYDYAQFWRQREALRFSTEVVGETLYITIPDSVNSPSFSWVIPNRTGITNAAVRTESGELRDYEIGERDGGWIVHRHSDYLAANTPPRNLVIERFGEGLRLRWDPCGYMSAGERRPADAYLVSSGEAIDTFRETAETMDAEYVLPVESLEAPQRFLQVRAVYR
jgi:hypothetical protein